MMLTAKNNSLLHNILLFVIIVIGCAMRFYNYSSWSLSNDELSALARLQYSSFSEMIEQGVKQNDMHPAGVQSFLWMLTSIIGNSVAVVRLPFVLFGCLSIPLVYLISKNWFNKNAALLSTSLFSILQFPILYSQLARPYSPGLFFSLIAVYCLTKIIIFSNSGPNKLSFTKYHLIFSLSGVACMYIHYFCFLFLAIAGTTSLFLVQKKDLFKLFVCGIAMFLLYIPAYSTFIHHFSIGGLGGEQGWLGPPKKSAIFEYLFYSLNSSMLIIIIAFLAILIPVFYNQESRKFSKYHVVALIFAFLLIIIAYFYSIYMNPVFQYSILIFGFPYLVIFVFSFLPDEVNSKLFFLITIGIIFLGASSTIKINSFYSTRYFAVFKEVAEQTVAMQNKYGKENLEKIISVINPSYIHYYLPKDSSVIYDSYQITSSDDRRKLQKLILQSQKNYFLNAWSNSFNDPAIHLMIRQHFPFVKEMHQYYNSGIYLYSKSKEIAILNTPKIFFSFYTDFEKKSNFIDSSLIIDDQAAYSGNYISILDSLHEYSTTIKFSADSMEITKGKTLEFSVWVKSTDVNDAQLIFSVGDDKNNVVWRSSHIDDYYQANNQWQQCFLAYTITEEIPANVTFSAYINNPLHKNILLDDFKINVVEYPISLE